MAYQEPDFAPWDGRRVPMTFLSGYLGAGKTTLINELLATADRPVGVLVNDVGAINVDARLIKRHHGDTIELTDGCVCCSLSDGFGAALDQIRARPAPPEHLVVELSGVADPSRVLPWASSIGFMLDGVVTLVDVDQLDDRMTQPVAAQTIEAQIRAADLVLCTKLDLVSPDTLGATLAAISTLAGDTPVLTESAQGAASLLHLGGRRQSSEPRPPPSLFDRHYTEVIDIPAGTDRAALKRLIDDLPADTVRAKGIAIDDDDNAWLAQVVGRRRAVTALPASERPDRSADREAIGAPNPLGNPEKLVVIRLPG